MRVDHSEPGRIVWRDAANNNELLSVSVPTNDQFDSDCTAAIYRYGVTQIVQDGGAVAADASFGDKLAGMRERIRAIESGTYRLGQRGGMVDADVYAALVALGMVKADTPDNRAKWRDAKKSQRDIFRRDATVAKYLADHASDAADAAGAVEAIFDQ